MSPILTNYIILLIASALLILSEGRAYFRKTRNFEDALSGRGSMSVLINKHLFSMTVLGVAVLCSVFLLDHQGIWLLPERDYLWLSVWSIAALAAFLAGFFAARGKIPGLAATNSSVTPSSASIAFYFMVRFLFLLIYEFFFRGVLLQSTAGLVSLEWAVAINIFIYALAHVFSERREFIGSIPFGCLLCLITINLESVWPAIVIHLLLSLPYEIKVANLYSRSVKRIKA